MQHVDGVGKVRHESLCVVVVTTNDVVDVEQFFAERRKEFVFLRGALLDQRAESISVAHVAGAHADALHLVGIGRPDSLQRGAEFRLAARRLADGVVPLVPGEDEVCQRRDAQARTRNTASFERVDLVEERRQVDDHAIADHRRDVRIQHAAWHEL